MIVVTGVSGQLGTAFRRRLGDDAHYLTRLDLDLTDPAAIRPVIEELSPALVVDDPMTAVARGTGVFLDKLDVFSRVLSADDDA